VARAGIDVGSLFTKAVVIGDDRRLLAHAVEPGGGGGPRPARAGGA
jgi:activator of 2-hydroxyglutaryl-CoA dehydratase